MLLKEIVNQLELVAVNVEDESLDIKKGYTGDLLSEVMGKAEEGALWTTVHTNMNVLAVVSMLDLSGVIVSEGNEVNEEFIKKAIFEGINVYKTKENNFTVSGKLYELGVR